MKIAFDKLSDEQRTSFKEKGYFQSSNGDLIDGNFAHKPGSKSYERLMGGSVKGQGDSGNKGGVPTSLSHLDIQQVGETQILNPQFQSPGAFFKAKASFMQGVSLNEASNFGTAPMYRRQEQMQPKSVMESIARGGGDEDDELPMTPGFAYMTHLFKRSGMGKQMKQKHKDALTKGMNIFTDAMEGVKTALQMVGLYSETNVGGLPFDLKDAMKAYFGDKEIDDVMKSQFQHDISDGVSKVDPKKIRKFVNHDGSLTWEILNDDKTIMNRFTFGDYAGTKIFAQGGYKKFAELLDKAKKELGPDVVGEFDSTIQSYKR